MAYALITGASKGIGKALALELAAAGTPLVLVARSKDILQQLSAEIGLNHKVDIKVFAIDLLSEQAPEKIYAWCVEQQLQVGMLINNAGVGVYGKFASSSIDKQVSMLALNQEVMVKLTYLFIPLLQQAGKAHILNVSSTAAFQSMPYFSVYAATKSFVLSFSRALRQELKRKKINVSCLCPGPTDSSFFDEAGYEGVGNDINYVKMTPEAVAKSALRGLEYEYAVIIPGFSNKIGAVLSRILPEGLTVKAVSYLFRPR